MPRLKIELPSNLPFSTVIPLRITDINYGGHLGNDAVLGLIHEARVRYLKSLGYSEFNVEGVSIIMADAQIVFSSEGFYGDEVEVSVGTSEADGVRCRMYYRMVNAGTKEEIACASTGIVFFDYTTRKPKPVPPAFRTKAIG